MNERLTEKRQRWLDGRASVNPETVSAQEPVSESDAKPKAPVKPKTKKKNK